MSLLVSDAYNNIERELNLIDQQVDQTDIFYYLTVAVNYFGTAYAFPTALKKFDALFFNGVREYSVASDFGTLIEPQRYPSIRSPHFMSQTGRELTHWPHGRRISVQYDGASPYLLIEDDEDSMASLLSSCEDTTTVAIGGDGSNLSLDNMIYTEGLGSFRFQITGVTGQTTFTFASNFGPMDITAFLTQNWGFLDLISPTTNTVPFSSVKLRLGNDATHYHEFSATTRYRGTSILTGYGQIGFDFTSKTDVGTVTDTNITWMQIVLNHGTTGINGIYHLDNIFTAQGISFQIPYYSVNNILTGTANPPTTPTNVVTLLTDIILLPVQCNEAIIYKALELIAASPNVANQSFANYAARELKPKEDLLMSLYPVERSLVQSQWYKRTNFKRGRVTRR